MKPNTVPSQSIPLEQVKEGMTTAEGLKDGHGQLLLPAGTVIEARHLRALSRWEIAYVPIQIDQAMVEAVPRPSAERMAEAELALKSVFRRADLEQPFMQAVWQSCVLREASRNGKGHHHA